MLLGSSVRSLFRSASRNFSKTCPALKDKKIDPIQQKSMQEKCFLVSGDDKVLGTATKQDCHTVQPNGNILLHRGFSVFLFNNHGDLLLQKRSEEKLTYPDCYTNSCCSHPIADIPGEEEEKDALGVKRAAVRRLEYELGIPAKDIALDKLHYLTRIHYRDTGNGQFGEHEIDYVLFLKGDYSIKPNPNEISEISYVPRAELDEYLPTLSTLLTPWFSLILKHRLKLWWDNLDNLEKFKDHKKIHKLK